MVIRHLAQIIVVGAQLVGRALSKAVREEMAASRAAAERHRVNNQNDGASSHSSWHASADSLQGITLKEAKQILNIEDLEPQTVEKNYEHLFSVNEKAKGGSLYLQSKIFRAKERIDYELNLDERSERKKDKPDSKENK